MIDNTENNSQNKLESLGIERLDKNQERSNESHVYQERSCRESKKKNKNNFKWSYEEHAKYIYFLELNKAKIKSKLIRKSNAFFKEMERFLQSKTALQCRSHHQKFQQRYKFPHRIITGEKRYIPVEIYKSVVQTTRFTDFIINKQNGENNHIFTLTRQEENINKKEYATISCQTQICDIEEQIRQPVVTNYAFPYPEMYMYYHPYQNIY